MTLIRSIATAVCVTGLAFTSWAQAQNVEVQNAWARATVQGQKASGAFMTLTAQTPGRLVSVSSPVAGVAEVHEMKMEGDVMKMRALANGLELPAGKPVELKPGGYHVMLMDLKGPVKAGDVVPIQLTIETAAGKRQNVEVKAQARAMTMPAGGQGGHGGHGSHGGHKH